MAHRGGHHILKGAGAVGATDSLRRGDLLSGTGAGQFDVQMTPQMIASSKGPAASSTSTATSASGGWTSTMASAARARAQAVKARNERERMAHNRNSVKPPDQCEALVYAAGFGPCVDVVRSSCGGGGGEGYCWQLIPSPLRWLLCGADTPLTLAQEHGFNYVAPRTKGKGDFGQVHDLGVHVPRMQAQAAFLERQNLYVRIAITVILGFLTAATLWHMMPTPAPDAQWACDATSAVAAKSAVDTWARNDRDRDRIFAALMGRARTVEDRHPYLHCPFSTSECETGRLGRVAIASTSAEIIAAEETAEESREAAEARAYPPNTSPGFVGKFFLNKVNEDDEKEEEDGGGGGGIASTTAADAAAAAAARKKSATVSMPRGSLGTCAVVGRAWPEDIEEAVRSSRGARIDAHDTVIRLQRRGPGRRAGGEAVGSHEAEAEETSGLQVVDAQDEADLMGVRTDLLFMERVATVRTVRGTYARRPGDDEEDVPESMYLVNVESAWPPGGYNRHKKTTTTTTTPPPPDTSGYVNSHPFAGEELQPQHTGRGAEEEGNEDEDGGGGRRRRRGLTAEVPACFPNCHHRRSDEDDTSRRDPKEYEGTARREKGAGAAAGGGDDDPMDDEETKAWLHKISEATGTTAAEEYKFVNDRIAEQREEANKRGNPWDPIDPSRARRRSRDGSEHDVKVSTGAAAAAAADEEEGAEFYSHDKKKKIAAAEGATRTDPFSSTATTLSEEASKVKAEEEEMDRWVEGTTGGPVGSELADDTGGVYGPDVIFKAWNKPVLRVTSGGLRRVRTVLREAIERLAPAPAKHVMRAGYGLVDAADAAEERAAVAESAAAAAERVVAEGGKKGGGRKGGIKKRKKGKKGKKGVDDEEGVSVRFVNVAGDAAGRVERGEGNNDALPERTNADEAEAKARNATAEATAAAEVAAAAEPELPTLLVVAHALQLSGLCTRVDAYGLGTPEAVPTYDTSKPREQWRAVRDLLVAGLRKEKFCAVN